jgi:hypothetical protein
MKDYQNLIILLERDGFGEAGMLGGTKKEKFALKYSSFGLPLRSVHPILGPQAQGWRSHLVSSFVSPQKLFIFPQEKREKKREEKKEKIHTPFHINFYPNLKHTHTLYAHHPSTL